MPDVLERMKERFELRWLIFVGDRGMVGRSNLPALEEAAYDWVVGVRLRTRPQLADAVLSDSAGFETVAENLEVNQVKVEGTCCVVCRNPDQARRDPARREAAIERLEARLGRSGVKGLVTRSGFRRFLRIQGEEATIDHENVECDGCYDGIWVLQTSTALPTAEVAQAYKSLWPVERVFRTLKSPLQVRPVRHWTEPQIRGHIALCSLAFLLRTVLERWLFAEGEIDASFTEVLDALHQIQEVDLEIKEIPLELVTEPPRLARQIFQPLGIRLPVRVQELARRPNPS